MFVELGLQYHYDGSSVSNIFESSFTDEVTGLGKAIFEGGFHFKHLRQIIILIAQIQHSIERKTGLHLHPLKSIKKLGVKYITI